MYRHGRMNTGECSNWIQMNENAYCKQIRNNPVNDWTNKSIKINDNSNNNNNNNNNNKNNNINNSNNNIPNSNNNNDDNYNTTTTTNNNIIIIISIIIMNLYEQIIAEWQIIR